MSGFAIYLVLGLLLIALLIALFVRLREANRTSFEPLEDTRLGELPSPELTNRIFGSEDWEFIASQGSAPLRRLFLSQRKKLAIVWVRTFSADMRRLMRVHRTSARTNSALKPMPELRVTLGFLVFQIACKLFICAIWLSGPTRMRGFAGTIGELSERVGKAIIQLLPTQQSAERNAV